MSLFEPEDVAPPQECSRCGRLVVQTSLFCPHCGQSRVTPLTTPPEQSPAAAPQDTTVDDATETPSEETSGKADTLTRATQWIRRTLGRGEAAAEQAEKPSATEEDSGADEDSPLLVQSPSRPGSYPERLSQSSRARARFVLTTPSGSQFTLGETPGGIGSSEEAPDGDRLHWIQLQAEDGSIDAIHVRFGVDDGVLWVEDANSVYGTIVTEPGRAALQCVPYERYSLVRGSEIRLGSVALLLS